MKNHSSRYSKYALGLFVFILTLALVHWIGNSGFLRPGALEAKVIQESAVSGEEPVLFERANPAIQAVMAVQERHTDVLMAEPGIVGTATGLSKDGKPAILVFAKSFESAKAAVIPARLEGVPVIVKITGEIRALKGRPAGKEEKVKVDPTARFDRPVPIGVSTGHPNITAGTIACRVTDGTDVYALSNNHVYANENMANIDEDNVIQPGAYDGGTDPDDAIGTLSDFEPIDFVGGDNTIDGAIAMSSTELLGNSTPSDGSSKPLRGSMTHRLITPE